MSRFSKMLLVLVLILSLTLGAGAEQVKLISGISLTPDGSRVVFSWRGDVWSGSVAGGRIERLTAHKASDGYPCVSRDGKWIAFSSNRTGAEQVYRMPLLGGKPTQLTFHSEGTRAVQFAGDDQTLFVSGGRDHWWRWNTRYFSISASKPQSGEILLLDAYGAMASQSPDGKSILFTREGMTWARKGYQGSKTSQIWIKRDGTEGYEKLLGTKQQDCRYPLWAPDGESFYYVSDEDGTRNLWVYRLKSGKRKQITKYEDDGIVAPAISQDGKTIVFRRLFDLYRMDPAKNKMPQLIDLAYEGDLFLDDEVERNLVKADDVAFSRTGKVMSFISGGDIWVMDTVLKEPVQVTDTEAWETDPVFSRDGKTLFYIGQTDGQVDIMSVRRSDESVPWWRNSKYVSKKITDDAVVEHSLDLSTKGNYLSYVRSREGLWIRSLGEEENEPRKIVSTWSGVSYDWSPDENWITYSASDDDFNYDIFIVNVGDPTQITNVSRHPDNETNPVWSRDGKSIAFVGRRVDQEVDIHYVPLVKELHERTKRDVTLERALKANSEIQQEVHTQVEDDEVESEPGKKPVPSATPKLLLNLENLHRRIRTFSIPNVSESGVTWSPDSKTLIFNAKIDNKEGIYSVQPYVSSTPKLLLPVKAKIVEWKSTGNRIYWLKEGVPGWGSGSGSGGESYTFRARQTYSQSAYQRQVFIEGWRTMRDDFYDGRFNNRNWDAVRRKYEDMAARCKSNENFARVMALMLGELNGSHLGFRGKSDPVPSLSPDDVTAHLGVIFDSTFEGPGWKVHEVLRNSPASKVGSLLKVGDVIISVDGLEIDPGVDESQVMNGKVAKDVLLTVERDEMTVSVTIRPTTYASIRSLLYERWLDVNRARVDALSDNRFAYLHIAAMNTSSFQRFERELFEVAAGKEGMVIDVRENGGGFTTDHLLTILTQPRHAITRPRGGGEGYPQDRMVYASWNKPIVVLCNQNSHSNAEIFSHAIKALGRGRVVGVPTSGSVISTGSRTIMDAGSIRVPFRGWYLLGDGQDMELNGAQPHVIIWPQPGAIPAGIDKQLDKAVDLLIEDVKNYQSKPSPVLIKASERP